MPELSDRRGAVFDRRIAGAATGARGLALAALTLGAVLPAAPAPAEAETLSISATGLVMRNPGVTDAAAEQNGVFVGQTPSGRYFVPVVFPVTTGERICSFTMAYEDINAADAITARLMRKTYAVGGPAFNAPTVIATVKSATGVVSTVREATTTAIKQPGILATRSFYYIEADIPTTNLNILGFQIVHKPSCP